MFFNVRIVSRSPAEISTPICALMGLWSHANLTCLLNLAFCCMAVNFKVKNVFQYYKLIAGMTVEYEML